MNHWWHLVVKLKPYVIKFVTLSISEQVQTCYHHLFSFSQRPPISNSFVQKVVILNNFQIHLQIPIVSTSQFQFQHPNIRFPHLFPTSAHVSHSKSVTEVFHGAEERFPAGTRPPHHRPPHRTHHPHPPVPWVPGCCLLPRTHPGKAHWGTTMKPQKGTIHGTHMGPMG